MFSHHAETVVGLLMSVMIGAHLAVAWLPALTASVVALDMMAVSVWAEGWMAASTEIDTKIKPFFMDNLSCVVLSQRP